MVTVLEEAMDLTDYHLSVCKLLLEHGISDPDVANGIYGLRHSLEIVANLLALVEIEDAEVPDTPTTDYVEDSEKPTIVKNITYEEMMSKQYLESEHPEAVPGTTDALDDLMDSAPKVDLKAVHQLRMNGKGAKEIAASFGVSGIDRRYSEINEIFQSDCRKKHTGFRNAERFWLRRRWGGFDERTSDID